MIVRWEPCLGEELPLLEGIGQKSPAGGLITTNHHRLAKAPRHRQMGRLVWLAFWLMAGVVLTLLLLVASPTARARARRFWAGRVLAACGGQLQVTGTPQQPALWVANHISWLDIVALLTVAPVRFIAKSEVAHWPVLGWLAARHGTIFLQRGSRGHAATLGAEIAKTLANGETVVLFPEGTTSDGTTLHPFHAALLQPAIVTATPVQPVAIAYRDREAARTTAVAFTGEMSLWESLRKTVALAGFTVTLAFGPPHLPPHSDRKQLANATKAWIAQTLFGKERQ